MDGISRSIGRERPETLYVAFELNAYKVATVSLDIEEIQGLILRVLDELLKDC